MKLLKSLVLLFVSIYLIGCTDNDSPDSIPSFELSTSTIVASYSLNELVGSEKEIITLNSSGVDVQEKITDSRGSLFTDLILKLLSDGTFEITGSYALETTVTIDGEIDENQNTGGIVILNDSGTYTIDVDDELITFSSVNKDLLEGAYTIQSFDEGSMIITESSLFVNESEITTTTTTTTEFKYSFERQ